MTDIDFDELDKAVNSALAPRVDAGTDEPKNDSGVAEAASTPAEDAKKDETTGEAPKVIITPRRQPLASPAARRSGRFMDVVHPSSDMANEKKAAAPAPKVKIVPTENAPKPEELATKPVDTAPAAPIADPIEVSVSAGTPSAPHAQDNEAPEEIVKSDYPDPIDVAGPLSIAEEPPTPSEEEPKDKEEEVQERNEPVAASQPVAAGEAPFLPDAKVEKRPLGGFSADEESTPEAEVNDSQSDESQLPPEAELPAALQSDVVAVESDALPDMLPGQADEEEAGSDAPKEEPKSTAAQPAKEDKPVSHEEGMAQSIPQQYKSAPADADDEPRPVFDTDQYHQPLIPAHSGKKSHAWTFILLILALLVIGGTLGYFAFMSGL